MRSTACSRIWKRISELHGCFEFEEKGGPHLT
jgi:hypothetical protein